MGAQTASGASASATGVSVTPKRMLTKKPRRKRQRRQTLRCRSFSVDTFMSSSPIIEQKAEITAHSTPTAAR